MQNNTMRYICVALCVVLICAVAVSSAPAYNDYESLGDLYELMLQKEALDEQMGRPHQLVRKSNRLPTLRLRFGKRMDPYLTGSQYIPHPLRVYEEGSDN